MTEPNTPAGLGSTTGGLGSTFNSTLNDTVLPSSYPTHFTESTCYYEVLNLEKSNRPSQDQIKKSYKRMALRYHPDKNAHEGEDVKHQAERLFKLVSRAYEVLSNEKLKEVYDKGGHKGIDRLNGNEEDEAVDAHNRSQRFGGGGLGGFGANDPFGHHSGFFAGSGPRTNSSSRAHSNAHGFPSFAFHDPFEIFREVFGMNMGGRGMHGSSSQPPPPRHQAEQNARRQRNADVNNDTFNDQHRNSHSQHASNHDDHHRRHANSHQQQHRSAHHGMGMMMDPFSGMGMGMGMGGFGGMGGGFGNMASMMQQQQRMMDTMMMGSMMGGGGGGGGLSSQTMSFSSNNAGGGRNGGGRIVSTSTSSTTRIVNGQRVTRTVRRQTDASGHTTEDVSESTEPPNGMNGGMFIGGGHPMGMGGIMLGW